MQRHGACNSKALLGLASFLSFRHRLKSNLLNVAFSDHLLEKNPPSSTWFSFFFRIYRLLIFTFVSYLPATYTPSNKLPKPMDTVFHRPQRPEQ